FIFHSLNFNLKYRVADTEVYLPRQTRGLADENGLITLQKLTAAPGVVVFEFHGPLIFLNIESFKKRTDLFIIRPIIYHRLEAAKQLMELCCINDPSCISTSGQNNTQIGNNNVSVDGSKATRQME